MADIEQKKKVKGTYDPATRDAIDEYAKGTRIKAGRITPQEHGDLGSENSQYIMGAYHRAEGEKMLRNANPDLSDNGVRQTMKVGGGERIPSEEELNPYLVLQRQKEQREQEAKESKGFIQLKYRRRK